MERALYNKKALWNTLHNIYTHLLSFVIQNVAGYYTLTSYNSYIHLLQ